MTPHTQLSGPISAQTSRDRGWSYLTVTVPTGREELESVILQLALLEYELTERVVFSSPGDTLDVERGEASALSRDGERWLLVLAERELQFVSAFLLVYYRDGAADVDHVDVPVPYEDADDATVIVTVDQTKPPRSGEERRRTLAQDEDDGST